MSGQDRSGCSCALALLLTLGAAHAQPDAEPVTRPQAASRLVKVFDFEEEQTNPGQVPQHWYRAQDDPHGARRPGFPVWNKGELRYNKDDGAFRGSGAVVLPTQGGSTVLVLGDGVLPIFDNADYLVTAMVRTVGLAHAKACIAARFLDNTGKPIGASQVQSELLSTGGAWKPVSIELIGDFPQAAYMQLEMTLLQPEQQPQAAPLAGRFTLWPQDYKGEAWFDDLTVMQLPRVELTTGAPANIVVAPQTPQLSILVRDLTGEALAIAIDVVDHKGSPAARFDREIGAGTTNTTWTPSLTKLGWYRASMKISNQAGDHVGGAAVDFIWLPSLAPTDPGAITHGVKGSADRDRFGLVIDDLPARLTEHVPELVHRIGTGSITLPVWSQDLTPQTVPARSDALLPLVGSLLEDWQEVTLSLGRVPAALSAATHLDSDNPWALLLTDSDVWMPYAAPLFERFGQRISRWQIGLAGDDQLFWRSGLGAEADSIRESLSAVVPGPVLVLPSRADREWSQPAGDPAGTRSETISFAPSSMTPEGVRLAAAALTEPSSAGAGLCPALTMVLEGHPPETFGYDFGAAELVKRAVEFWAAAPACDGKAAEPGMAIHQPWDWTGSRRPQLMPRPELAAWRTLVDHLSDRRVVGSLPVAPGAVCYILAPTASAPARRGGALVAWNNSADPGTAVLNANLGQDAVELIDVFGNPRHAAPPAPGERNTRIPLTQDPIFIEGIDVELVQFLASIDINTPFLESSNDQHEREITVVNHWSGPISGTITVLEPGGFDTGRKDRSWQLSPRTMTFSAAPRETVRLPFTIAFSPVEEVGLKDFVMAVDLSAGKQYGTIEVRRHVEVGVKDIHLDLSYSFTGSDLVVEAAIANMGESSLTLELTAFAPGQARSKGSVIDLAPSNNTVRQFRYTDAKLRGQRVLVSIYDPTNGVRLNKSILIQ